MSKKSKNRTNKKMMKCFYIIRFIIDYLVDMIFKWIYRNTEPIKLPPAKEEFLTYSATFLASKIRNKELTSEEVVKAFISRVQEVNKILNAIVDERFDNAIEEAKEVDQLLATTQLSKNELQLQKPFFGVPFTSKESTSAKGMSFSFGLVCRKNERATDDAYIVERMKDSGAILIGVTNVPELNLWCETRNNVFGQTQNPYDVRRTVGGSSGGESSIIAACGSPFGIGTDVGGSARMPAYFCGIFGHKPSAGLISTRGMTWRSGTEGDTMVTAGTMTRCAEDIAPFLRVLLGDNWKRLKLDLEVNMENLRIFYVTEPGDKRLSPVSKESKEVIIKAVDHLTLATRQSAEKIDLSGFKYSLSLWRHGMTKEPSQPFGQCLANLKGEVSLPAELVKLLCGKSDYTLPALMRLIDLNVLPATNPKWAENETNRLRNELLKLLGDNGVLLFPSCPTDAPYHYASFLRPYNFAYWAIFNVLKFPVTQVPIGLSKNGLPLGLQVVAAPYNDHLSIAVARELENAFGGWKPPYL